jgi:hypothetical protein
VSSALFAVAYAACATFAPLSVAQTPLKPPQQPPTAQGTQLGGGAAKPAAPASTGTSSTAPTSLAAPKPAATATGASPASAPIAINSASAIKFSPGMTIAQIRNLQPGAMIELNNGRKVKATQFVATADALKGLSGKPAKLRRMDFTFTRPVAVAQLKLNSTNLAAARAMPSNTVLELSNGLKLTTGELKQLDTLESRTNIRQMLIAQAGAGASANQYAGRPAIKLRTKADIEQLKGKPDSTIVEAPDGSRSTLGELKAALAEKFGGARK